MSRFQQKITRVLVVTCFGGALLGGAVVASAADGKELYQKNCQSCHGADGNPPPAMAKSMGIPPASALKQKDDAAMLHIIAEGAGKMPGYGKKMSAAEQKQVFEYMKTLAK
jgi:mono/diheme cytochrome c family protein